MSMSTVEQPVRRAFALLHFSTLFLHRLIDDLLDILKTFVSPGMTYSRSAGLIDRDDRIMESISTTPERF